MFNNVAKKIRLVKLTWLALKKVGVDRLTTILTVAADVQKKRNSLFELEKVAAFIGISADKLQVKNRKREIAEARFVAMYLARQNTKESLAEIGRNIGNKDHATVLYAIKTVNNLLDTNPEFKEKWLPLILKES